MLDPHTFHMMTAMIGLMMIPLLIMAVLFLIPYWFIWKKAGFSPWLSLLMFVPLVNLIMLYVLAFTDWKVVPIAQLQQATLPPRV
jgi:hypothetical protein